jgi:hypothetical protein
MAVLHSCEGVGTGQQACQGIQVYGLQEWGRGQCVRGVDREDVSAGGRGQQGERREGDGETGKTVSRQKVVLGGVSRVTSDPEGLGSTPLRLNTTHAQSPGCPLHSCVLPASPDHDLYR